MKYIKYFDNRITESVFTKSLSTELYKEVSTEDEIDLGEEWSDLKLKMSFILFEQSECFKRIRSIFPKDKYLMEASIGKHSFNFLEFDYVLSIYIESVHGYHRSHIKILPFNDEYFILLKKGTHYLVDGYEGLKKWFDDIELPTLS